jgi:hypothetical protein
MNRCHRCGADNSNSATYCHLCARELKREAPEKRWQTTITCDFCGKPNLEEEERCFACGDPLHKPEKQALAPLAPTLAAEEQEACWGRGDSGDWDRARQALREGMTHDRAPAPNPTLGHWRVRPARRAT